MEDMELIVNFNHLNQSNRFKYSEFGNLIEWEQLVYLTWWQRLFRTDGQDRVWKRIYFGHIAPLEKCLETYNLGNKLKQLTKTNP